VKLLKRPKESLILLLTLILLVSMTSFSIVQVITNLLAGVISCLLFDAFFLKLRKIKLFKLSAAFATGLILAILISPSAPLYVFVTASLAAMFSKNFIRLKNFHVFNPAAFGAFTSLIIFNIPISWWAVSYSLTPALITIIGVGYITIIKLKKLPVLVSFYTALIITFLLLNVPLQAIFDYTAIFFVFVMLCEPMTSPNKKTLQLAYGGLAALLSFTLPAELVKDPVIFSLLLVNGMGFYFERVTQKI